MVGAKVKWSHNCPKLPFLWWKLSLPWDPQAHQSICTAILLSHRIYQGQMSAFISCLFVLTFSSFLFKLSQKLSAGSLARLLEVLAKGPERRKQRGTCANAHTHTCDLFPLNQRCVLEKYWEEILQAGALQAIKSLDNVRAVQRSTHHQRKASWQSSASELYTIPTR